MGDLFQSPLCRQAVVLSNDTVLDLNMFAVNLPGHPSFLDVFLSQ